MISMDFKGIAWVGNVYQKFEAMCLEVEEVMYQDTVKFVENQAQTVGSSVKKFYSDVMQDLLPPSSIDPVKVAAADLSLNPYADFGIYKKPKANIKKDTSKVDRQDAEDSKVIVGANAYYSSSFRVHNVDNFQPPSTGSVRGTGLELCLEQNEHRGLYKRKSRRDNHLQSEMSRPVPSMPKYLSRVSSCRELSENLEVTCDQIAMISSPAVVDVTGCDPSGAKMCKNNTGSSVVSTADTSTENPTPNMILPFESGADKEAKLICTSSNGTCSNSGVVSLMGSYISGDPKYSESASEDCLCPTGISGDCNLDVNENDGAMIQTGMETINEQLDDSKLEETCVLVDSEKFCLVTHRKDKPRSYKKKIQKALSSKRSARKQEYEQLAVQHGDMDAVSDCCYICKQKGHYVKQCPNQESAESLMPKKPPPHGICESEWELL